MRRHTAARSKARQREPVLQQSSAANRAIWKAPVVPLLMNRKSYAQITGQIPMHRDDVSTERGSP